MAWSYDAQRLADEPLYQVRFLIGDTNENDQRMQDEEISYLIGTSASVYYAAATACDKLVAIYSGKVSKSVGPLSISYGDVVAGYQNTAKSLRRQAAMNTDTAASFGGNSYAEKIEQAGDDDAIGTAARVNGMDYPGTDDANTYFSQRRWGP